MLKFRIDNLECHRLDSLIEILHSTFEILIFENYEFRISNFTGPIKAPIMATMKAPTTAPIKGLLRPHSKAPSRTF